MFAKCVAVPTEYENVICNTLVRSLRLI